MSRRPSYADPMLAWARAQGEPYAVMDGSTSGPEAYADPMLAWARAQDRPLARAARHLAALEPNEDAAYSLEPGWLFALPPIEVVVGLGDRFEDFEGRPTGENLRASGQPDDTFRPKRLVIDVPVPGVFTLKSLLIGNQLIVKGPIDAYAYSSARHGSSPRTARSDVCSHCGAPRGRLLNALGVLACRYCSTDFPPLEAVETASNEDTVGGPITAPTMRPSIRATVELGYTGWVWPGVCAGGPFQITVGLVGPRAVRR